MEFRRMHTFAVFLLIACYLVLSVEGRFLKSLSKNNSKQVLPPPTPTKASDFGDSIEGYKEDFRPTTPGNSPGVGHSFADVVEDIVEQNPASISVQGNGKRSIAGHSPGVGHSFADVVEDIVEQNPASISVQGNGKRSIAGHSPGVGHAYPNRSQNSEPNA
ncbi:hypothetical protein ERO13_A02G159500v2 [Gossypium hirsutum]|uniref:Uncharacterized protein n=1 Tax=Gossypium tomentosum TaxID=34277 RepID=A0A5D2RMW5_GOSTO|nr:hypothetical protein ERO13_A02G159500v2 [Gossypium hirsutum]TYI40864.1 hypothetical protein ES332_A02G193100v1 [Gossypium tomentosum]